MRAREMGWVPVSGKGLCSCGSVSSGAGRESRRGCVRGQEGAGGAGAHTQAMGGTEVLKEVRPSSLRLQPERLKGWRVKTPLSPSQTHSRELLSAGEKHNKAPKNRAEGEGAVRAWGSQPHAGLCPSPATSHPSRSAKNQPPAAQRGNVGTGMCQSSAPSPPCHWDAAVPALLKQPSPAFPRQSKQAQKHRAFSMRVTAACLLIKTSLCAPEMHMKDARRPCHSYRFLLSCSLILS